MNNHWKEIIFLQYNLYTINIWKEPWTEAHSNWTLWKVLEKTQTSRFFPVIFLGWGSLAPEFLGKCIIPSSLTPPPSMLSFGESTHDSMIHSVRQPPWQRFLNHPYDGAMTSKINTLYLQLINIHDIDIPPGRLCQTIRISDWGIWPQQINRVLEVAERESHRGIDWQVLLGDNCRGDWHGHKRFPMIP